MKVKIGMLVVHSDHDGYPGLFRVRGLDQDSAICVPVCAEARATAMRVAANVNGEHVRFYRVLFQVTDEEAAYIQMTGRLPDGFEKRPVKR